MYKLPVILVYGNGSDPKQYATVAEAQADAEALAADEFQIFTLYSSGKRPTEVRWTIAADTATNLRAVKKTVPKSGGERKGVWSETEIRTAVDNYKAGVSIADIANGLKRSYNATYAKLTSLGVFTPKPRNEETPG